MISLAHASNEDLAMANVAPLLTAEVGSARLEICVADITTLALDAIVNAANRTLLGGRRRRRRHPSRGGTGIARRVPNPRRLRDRPGKDHARLSAAGEARDPRGRAGLERRRQGRRGSVGIPDRAALDLAAAHRLASVAFPAISTGIYRFPPDRAARIAVGTVVSELAASPQGRDLVVFCCFAQEAADHHMAAFAELGLA